jgi:DNA mismatch repair protein MutS
MRQYMDIKAGHPDAVLLFRMGDFYEMFFEDAVDCAPILQIALTSRDGNIPMCGIPYHALDAYLGKLLSANKKIAVCEQVEDPKTATHLVKREVMRVITPGLSTEGEEDALLAAYAEEGDLRAAALLGMASGTLEGMWLASRDDLEDLLATRGVREVLLTREAREHLPDAPVLWNVVPAEVFSPSRGAEELRRAFGVASLKGFGIEAENLIAGVLGAALRYARETLRQGPSLLQGITLRHLEQEVVGPVTLRNLEIFATAEGRREGCFLSWFDRTRSPVGRRQLKEFLLHPLTDEGAIRRRQEAVAWLRERPGACESMQEVLRRFPDIPRILSRLGLAREHPREVRGMALALNALPGLARIFEDPLPQLLAGAKERMGKVPPVVAQVLRSLCEEIPLQLKEGNFIRPGVNPDLDELRSLERGGHARILGTEEEERRRTAIGSLRIKYNRVFGYFIEVPKAQVGKVPPEYIRKQTLVNCERYVTPEIKDLEEKILTASEKAAALEMEVYRDLKAAIALHSHALQSLAAEAGLLDAFLSMALASREGDFCLPEVHTGREVRIEDGWHPVVAGLVKLPFVPNDTDLSGEENQIVLLTGPNMGGKSTYLRQVGLIALLAQIGAFVPAKSASLGIADHIFTRVGSADFLFRGESTFMVEMLEMARILRQATPRSLVLLDEVGRGTATFDGLSIAWAVMEHLHEKEERRAQVLFATHYHELTELALLYPRIRNMTMAIKEFQGKIIFMHRVIPGTASKSYGIEVAQLAGVPAEVVRRAKRILVNLESAEIDPAGKPRAVHEEPFMPSQMSLFSAQEHSIVTELRKLEPETMSPIEALNRLMEWKKKL